MYFDEIHALRPLKETAHMLAHKEDWPPLYDVNVLNNNKVRSSCWEKAMNSSPSSSVKEG